MIRHRVFGLGLALVVMTCGVTFAQTPQSAEAVLAMRMVEQAQAILRQQPLTDAHWHQAAALLSAAHQIDGENPRYARLLADARMKLNDSEKALAALNDLRRLSPDNTTAQIEVIDLYLAQMQTSDQSLQYLRNVLNREQIDPVVRSAAAVRMADLLDARGLRNESVKVLDRALQLNSLNLAALTAKWQATSDDATPGQRAKMLVAMVRSSPANPEILSALARETAAAGLTEESVRWYGYATDVAVKSRSSLSGDVLLEHAAALLLNDQIDQAARLLDQMLASDPQNYPATVLRLIAERRRDHSEAAGDLKTQAKNILVNRLQTLRSDLGVKGATTQPTNVGPVNIPELGGDLPLVRKASERTRSEYVQAVGDLAWFEVFFDENTAEAEKLMKQISALAGDDAENRAFQSRMAGWIMLRNGKADEAQVKLSAAEKDPMAALGLVFAMQQDQVEKARELAQKLVTENPAGVIGAILRDELRKFDVRPKLAKSADEVREAVNSLPAGWMQVLERPATFYSLRAQPLKVTHSYGEPLLVKVTLQNLGREELTIGSDELIKPGLWFDVQLGGMYRQTLSGVAFERIDEKQVLRSRESVSSIVRLDQGELEQFLAQNPGISVSMSGSVRSNPVMLNDRVASAPAGYGAEFERPMQRGNFPGNPAAVGRAIATASSGEGADRMYALDLLMAMNESLQKQAAADPQWKALSQNAEDAISTARMEQNLNIKAYTNFLVARWAKPELQPPAVTRMLLEEASWQERLLGLVALSLLPPERQMVLARQAANDENALVKEFAVASLQLLQNPVGQPAN